MTMLLIYSLVGLAGGAVVGLLSGGIGPIIVTTLLITLPKLGINPEIAIHFAVGTSLAIIVLTTCISVVTHLHNKAIDWSFLSSFAPIAAIGALIGSLIAVSLQGRWLQIIFACFLLTLSLRMAFGQQRAMPMVEGIPNNWLFKIITFLLGVFSSMLGVCYGLLFIPYIKRYYSNLGKLVGTVSVCNFIVALIGLAPFVWQQPTSHLAHSFGYIYWPAFMAIGIFSSLSACFTSHLVSKLSPTIFQRIFAVILSIAGLKMLFI